MWCWWFVSYRFFFMLYVSMCLRSSFLDLSQRVPGSCRCVCKLLDRWFLRLNNHAGFAEKRERHCGGSGRESISLFLFLNMIIAFIRNAKLAIWFPTHSNTSFMYKQVCSPLMFDIHIASKILRAASNVPLHSERHALPHETFTIHSYWNRAVFVQMAYRFFFQRSEVHTLFSLFVVRRKCTTLRADHILGSFLFLKICFKKTKTKRALPMSTFKVRQLHDLNYGLMAQNTMQYADAMQCSTRTIWILLIIILFKQKENDTIHNTLLRKIHHRKKCIKNSAVLVRNDNNETLVCF